ncbi:unnamed protein product [Peniophora sp. CBMAI 1063]|nr:unnamed protein product [Peniophora sp. CBMAI 1063]
MSESDVPDGFKRVGDHPDELWSEAAFKHVFRLQEEEEKRDPDAYDIYIFNDFFGYACADLIRREMLSLGTKAASTTGRLELKTFQQFEALVLYMANSNGANVFPTIDDAELAEAIYNGYGSLWLSYLLNLEKAAKPDNLSSTNPINALNFKNVVRTAAKVLGQYGGLGFENDADDFERAMLRVLERNGMNGTPKKKLFLGENSGEDDEDEDMEDEDEEDDDEDEGFEPATDKDVTRIAKQWKMTPALQTLRARAVPVDFVKGRSWDISSWPAHELAAEKAKQQAIMDGFD